MTGLVSLSKSSSERLEAASVFSGIIVGIHPISVSSGARKDYFVASINSSILVRTRNLKTASSSKKISSTFTLHLCRGASHQHGTCRRSIEIGFSDHHPLLIKLKYGNGKTFFVVHILAPTSFEKILAIKKYSLMGSSGRFDGG